MLVVAHTKRFRFLWMFAVNSQLLPNVLALSLFRRSHAALQVSGSAGNILFRLRAWPKLPRTPLAGIRYVIVFQAAASAPSCVRASSPCSPSLTNFPALIVFYFRLKMFNSVLIAVLYRKGVIQKNVPAGRLSCMRVISSYLPKKYSYNAPSISATFPTASLRPDLMKIGRILYCREARIPEFYHRRRALAELSYRLSYRSLLTWGLLNKLFGNPARKGGAAKEGGLPNRIIPFSGVIIKAKYVPYHHRPRLRWSFHDQGSPKIWRISFALSPDHDTCFAATTHSQISVEVPSYTCLQFKSASSSIFVSAVDYFVIDWFRCLCGWAELYEPGACVITQVSYDYVACLLADPPSSSVFLVPHNRRMDFSNRRKCLKGDCRSGCIVFIPQSGPPAEHPGLVKCVVCADGCYAVQHEAPTQPAPPPPSQAASLLPPATAPSSTFCTMNGLRGLAAPPQGPSAGSPFRAHIQHWKKS
ncbi:hypothetical protein C8R44DRAFT_856729 [Mycena epipterygia]|nr:hypothetical protein C8R44DRAFT_856729 [Mycena epipterygia]